MTKGKLSRRTAFLLTFLLLIFGMLNSQVRIKERVEIEPKMKNVLTSQTSNSIDLPYLSITKPPLDNSKATYIKVLQPCSLEISGTYKTEGGNCDMLSLNRYQLVGTEKVSADCGQIFSIDMLSGCICGGYSNVVPTIQQSNTKITVAVIAKWCCVYPYFFDAFWSFNINVIPGSNSANSLVMKAYPDNLNADSMYQSNATIYAYVVNAEGRPFQYCAEATMKFTIENPITGVTIYGNETTTTLDYHEYNIVALTWDRGDLPSEEYILNVTAEAFGLSQTIPITLIKRRDPRVEITNPPQDMTVYVSENRQPVIKFEEDHLPRDGAYEPIITWNPSNIINVKDYYNQIEDTMSIIVEATAQNSVGVAKSRRVILLKKIEEIDHFEVSVTPDTIFFYNNAWLKAVAIDKYGNEVLLDENTEINISITPNVGIYYYESVPYRDLKKGDIRLYTYEEDGSSSFAKEFTITVTGEGAVGTGKLVVTPPSCIVLSVSKKQIRPGERTTINIMQKTWDGQVIHFSANQEFSLWINSGEKYGTLYCPASGETGSIVFGQQPFIFIAADSIDIDPAVVEIEVWASSGEVAGSIGITTNDTLKLSESKDLSKRTNANKISDTKSDIIQRNIEHSMKNLDFLINKESDEKRRIKLSKILEKQKARLSYETAKTPEEKQKAIAKMKQVTVFASEEVQCNPTAQIIIKKDTEKYCVQVIVPENMITGEEAKLQLKRVGSDGIPQDYPSGQLFDLQLLGPEGECGLLEAGGQRGTSLSGVTQPVKYIAPANISSDSVVIQIVAAESGSGGTTAKINSNGTALSTKTSIPPSIQTVLKSQGTGTSCPIKSLTIQNIKSLTLTTDNYYVDCQQSVTLSVSADGGGRISDDVMINVYLHLDDGSFGDIESANGQRGKLLTVPYKDIREGKVKYEPNCEGIKGRFPQGVRIGVNLVKKENIATEIGIIVKGNGIGEWFCQLDYMNQYDSYKRRTKDKLRDSVDSNGDTVYHTVASKGCALTCMAMLARAYGVQITPSSLVDFMNANPKDCWGDSGKVMYSSLLNYCSPLFKKIISDGDGIESGIPLDLQKVDDQLSAGKPVIVQVSNNGNNHFVIITGKRGNDYDILDPGSRNNIKTKLSMYNGKVYKMITYQLR